MMPGWGQPVCSALLQHQGGKTRGEGMGNGLRLSLQVVRSSSAESCPEKLVPGTQAALHAKTLLKRVCSRHKGYTTLTFLCWPF